MKCFFLLFAYGVTRMSVNETRMIRNGHSRYAVGKSLFQVLHVCEVLVTVVEVLAAHAPDERVVMGGSG